MHYIDEIKHYIPENEQEKLDQQLILDYLTQHHNGLTRENVVAHLTVSSWILNQSHNRVLLAYHNIYNSWSWTGGHADGDGNLLKVAIKEAKEETGIHTIRPLSQDIFSIESLCVNGHMKRGRYVSSHLHLNVTFLLEANDEEPLIVKEDENKKLSWFTFEEALQAPNEEWMVEFIYEKLTHKVIAWKTLGKI